jgi:sarcosine oxidase subunit alpha
LPYGTEALSIMRVQKGHVAGGELNGQLTARDLGLERMMSSKKDYIGRMLAQRPAFLETDRPRLIGIRPVEHGRQITAGAHFLDVGAAAVSENDLGYVTSVANSPTLGYIGLGVLKRGPERIGEQVIAYDPLRGLETRVEVCNPVFYDPTGARLRG